MSSLVLDLQQEVLSADCDILNALRKAHLIATKLKLTEFDKWVVSELNGYDISQLSPPNYRTVNGVLKAKNPYHGWIPVQLSDVKIAETLCSRELPMPISEIIELSNRASGTFQMPVPPPSVKLDYGKFSNAHTNAYSPFC